MNEPELTELGRLLAEAVPPLPELPDRLVQVRTRVRRARARDAIVGAAVSAVMLALALAAPQVLSRGEDGSGAVLDASRCPVIAEDPRSTPDPGGRPVLGGATEAMLCERRQGAVVDSWVLRADVDELVDTLNHPAREATAQGYSDQAHPCPASAQLSQYSLVLRYPDGHLTTIVVEPGCEAELSLAEAGGQVNVLAEFHRLYRAQQSER